MSHGWASVRLTDMEGRFSSEIRTGCDALISANLKNKFSQAARRFFVSLRQNYLPLFPHPRSCREQPESKEGCLRVLRDSKRLKLYIFPIFSGGLG
jgi:hypothetical protein